MSAATQSYSLTAFCVAACDWLCGVSEWYSRADPDHDEEEDDDGVPSQTVMNKCPSISLCRLA